MTQCVDESFLANFSEIIWNFPKGTAAKYGQCLNFNKQTTVFCLIVWMKVQE